MIFVRPGEFFPGRFVSARGELPFAAMQTLDSLKKGFGASSDRARFEAGQGGLIRTVLSSPASEAHVYLHGAQVTHFGRAGQPPLLFLSNKSLFQRDKAIRGGVPICFPWFGPRAGDKDAPMHGFARLCEWTVESVEAAGAAATSITLGLRDSEETRKLWPHAFAARYTVTAGETLGLELIVTNTGKSEFTFEEALHTYFAVSDVKNVTVEGLGGVDYIDKTDGGATKTQGGKPIRIVEETDRVYLNTTGACTVVDPGQRRRIVVSKENSEATVVWNPWIAKARAMADFGDEEWPKMLCVETCNVGVTSVSLSPGASHVMRAVVSAKAG
jgi:glucose-6-phosphate 1-epimerase